MKLNRRGFLASGFGVLSSQLFASDKSIWRGQALGADISISLPRQFESKFKADLPVLFNLIEGIESIFSLYNANSTLSRLNQEGVLHQPPVEMIELLDQVALIHKITNHHFDPTIQPLWEAWALGGDIDYGQSLIGFNKVLYDRQKIQFADKEMALSFNGIVQGYMTDKVTDFLKKKGYSSALVNMGEFSAISDGWRIGIENSDNELIHTQTLDDCGIATSAPFTMMLSNMSHILPVTPDVCKVQWKTVSVASSSATIADGISTGLVYMPYDDVLSVNRYPQIKSIVIETLEGEVIELT